MNFSRRILLGVGMLALVALAAGPIVVPRASAQDGHSQTGPVPPVPPKDEETTTEGRVRDLSQLNEGGEVVTRCCIQVNAKCVEVSTKPSDNPKDGDFSTFLITAEGNGRTVSVIHTTGGRIIGISYK